MTEAVGGSGDNLSTHTVHLTTKWQHGGPGQFPDLRLYFLRFHKADDGRLVPSSSGRGFGLELEIAIISVIIHQFDATAISDAQRRDCTC